MKITKRFKEKNVELVACVMKRLWYRRNSWVFEKKFEHPRQLLKAAT